MDVRITRVFSNGNSQAVRIPAAFRLDAEQVRITRTESGDLLISALPLDRGAALLDALQAVGNGDEGFITALEAGREQPLPVQDRDAL